MYRLFEDKTRGFTLIELLIAMTIGLIIMGALTSTFLIQRDAYDVQEQVTEMVQGARAALDMMSREIRMGGYYDPTVSSDMQRHDPTDTSTFVGIPYDTTQLKIVSDFRGTNENDPADGDTDDPDEQVIYSYDAANLEIQRNGVAFAENVLPSFAFSYLDSGGNPATTTDTIRQIKISITVQTEKPDPKSGGHRTYTLTSQVTPRNLAY